MSPGSAAGGHISPVLCDVELVPVEKRQDAVWPAAKLA